MNNLNSTIDLIQGLALILLGIGQIMHSRILKGLLEREKNKLLREIESMGLGQYETDLKINKK